MAVSISSRALFRSILYRCGRWQQSQSRPLCKGPPDDSSEIKREVESVAGEKQDIKTNEEKETKQEQEAELSLELKDNEPEKSAKSIAEKLDIKTNEDKETKQEQEQEAELSLELKNNEPEKSAKSIADEKRAAAKKKLKGLLMSLATSDTEPAEPISRVMLSKPKARPKAVKKKWEKTSKKEDSLSPLPTAENIEIEPELVMATKEVAESLGGDVQATASELLSTLRSHASESSADDKPTTNLSDLFVGMKVERSQSKPVMERQQSKSSKYGRDRSSHPQSSSSEESRYRKSWSRPSQSREHVTVDLFGSEILEIFNVEKLGSGQASIGESVLPVWDAAHQRELQLAVTHPPHNAFVEMIQWTKRGKLWKFPIDNEVGLEEEKKIGFHEHVFLEHHLEGWCPRRGPIRHFMELVCVGLSKNPHLTVERKMRHIQWYQDYFEAKHDVLKEIGAIEAEQ